MKTLNNDPHTKFYFEKKKSFRNEDLQQVPMTANIILRIYVNDLSKTIHAEKQNM